MQVSDQIIAVLDDLCRRFGIAIDWSQQNVIPYIKDICERYIQYEILTSVAYCVIATVIVAMFGISWMYANKINNKTGSFGSGEAKFALSICFCVAVCIAVLICSVQSFDIIACHTIPEKKIVEYINHLISLKK